MLAIVGGKPVESKMTIRLTIGTLLALVIALPIGWCNGCVPAPAEPPPVTPTAGPPTLPTAPPTLADATAPEQDVEKPPAKPCVEGVDYEAPKTRAVREMDASRIVGGKRSKWSERTCVVAVGSATGSQFCGATLVGRDVILSAAHCQIRAGELALVYPGFDPARISQARRIRVVESRISTAWNPSTNDMDFAFARLATPPSDLVPAIAPCELATAEELDGALRAVAAGWGHTTEGGSASEYLLEVEVPIVPNDVCDDSYSYLTPNMLCAGEAGADSCQGDSGGPLFILSPRGDVLAGVTSFGRGCARPGYPGAYANVTSPQAREFLGPCKPSGDSDG